jgi:putative transposase
MSKLIYQHTYKRNLPHIQPPGATLFVTFRLAGSLPVHVSEQLLRHTEQSEKRLQLIANPDERVREAYREQRQQFGRWDAALDQAQCGPTWLGQPEVAGIVAGSLHYLDQEMYDLLAFCIMPNHAHVLFTPSQKEDESYHALSAILHSLKRHTAREANRLLQRHGQFWQHESYDHIVRDAGELHRIILYVVNNPVKAGLVDSWDDWPWTYSKSL